VPLPWEGSEPVVIPVAQLKASIMMEVSPCRDTTIKQQPLGWVWGAPATGTIRPGGTGVFHNLLLDTCCFAWVCPVSRTMTAATLTAQRTRWRGSG
jgi:hypothetical protein